MIGVSIRPSRAADRAAIHRVEERAFGQPAEADLVDALVAAGDVVLELVAEKNGAIVGHILFSRLHVDGDGGRFAAVALAPLAVHPSVQRNGVGSALVTEGHARLRAAGERLAVVVGDPAYYGRFGYGRGPAEGFASLFQCEAMQALAWDDTAPRSGALAYAPAFGAL